MEASFQASTLLRSTAWGVDRSVKQQASYRPTTFAQKSALTDKFGTNSERFSNLDSRGTNLPHGELLEILGNWRESIPDARSKAYAI